MPASRFSTALALLTLLLSVVVAACSDPGGATDLPQQPTPAEGGVPVETLVLEARAFDERFSASGVIQAEDEVTVSSEIAGRIVRVGKEIGDRVRAGELLVQLDDRAQRAQVAKLRAEVERAQTQLAWAKRDLARQLELFETEVAAERARDDAQRMVDTSEDDLAARWADLEMAKVELDRTSIRSPLSGSVARRHVSTGEYVTPGAQLFDVVTSGAVEFVFSVGESDVIGMRTGQDIELLMDAYPGAPFSGTVAAISPAGSTGTRTYRVELRVSGSRDRQLLPGMAGRATVIRRHHANVFLIPESAILRDGPGSYVYLASGDRAARQDVEILGQTGTMAVVETGFDGLDGCIILGQAAVADGGPIRVRRTHDVAPTSVFD